MRNPLLAGAILIAVIAPSLAQTTPAPARTVLGAAVQTAKKSNRNILVHFGASW